MQGGGHRDPPIDSSLRAVWGAAVSDVRRPEAPVARSGAELRSPITGRDDRDAAGQDDPGPPGSGVGSGDEEVPRRHCPRGIGRQVDPAPQAGRALREGESRAQHPGHRDGHQQVGRDQAQGDLPRPIARGERDQGAEPADPGGGIRDQEADMRREQQEPGQRGGAMDVLDHDAAFQRPKGFSAVPGGERTRSGGEAQGGERRDAGPASQVPGQHGQPPIAWTSPD
jgi:hypothetical protein